jgi:hypothetical protein
MPAIKLDVTDAAELAEMAGWAATPPASAHRWKSSSATPPTASASCVTTWSALCSCSAAATASPCSARHRTKPHARQRSRQKLAHDGRFCLAELARQIGYQLAM